VNVIRIAAAVILGADGRMLLVRKRGTKAFMLAGGKLEAGESASEAVRREVAEELGCGIAAAPEPLGRFSAPAANEAGHVVEAELFAVTLDGMVAPAAEIEEAVWHDPEDLESRPLAPLARTYALPLARARSRNVMPDLIRHPPSSNGGREN
jgi:8-oxo-dGTP diphosphatase